VEFKPKLHKKMKNLLFLSMLCFGAVAAQATERPVMVESKASPELRKIKVTIQVNGYTLVLQGNLDINIWSGTVHFVGTLSISGNGLNLTLPIDYTGDGNKRISDTELAETIIKEVFTQLGL
jgi:hypothetical protein